MPSIGEILRMRNQQDLMKKVELEAARREKSVASEQQLYSWVFECFSRLPRRHSEWYRRLWENRLLRCHDEPVSPKSISDYATRLACTALQTRMPLLVVLPEGDRSTSARIVATLAVLHSREDPRVRVNNRLLYIGNYSGMRYHMECSHVNELSLASLFPHTVVRGNRSTRSSQPEGSTLTELVCACRPHNAHKLINDYRPDALLIDITGSESKPWFPSVLEAAIRNKIPVVAWCNSYLSPEIEMARAAGWRVFTWCANPGKEAGANRDCVRAIHPGVWSLQIRPSLIASPQGSAGHLMYEAARALYNLRDKTDRPIVHEAKSLLNRALRSLARLATPLQFYEEESRYVWGLYPVKELLRGATRLVEVTRGAGMPGEVEQACDLLVSAYSLMEHDAPPLWHVLSQRINHVNGKHLVILPNVSSFRLFSGAISSYLNLSLQDLKELGIDFSYPKALSTESVVGRTVTVVGVPGSFDWPLLWPLNAAGNIEVLHYPHEFPLLRYHVRNLSARASFNLNENLEVLAILTGKEPILFDCAPVDHYSMAPPSSCGSGAENRKATEVEHSHLLPDLDPSAEWEKLVPDQDPQDVPEFGVMDSDGSAIVENPVQIIFHGGGVIYFDGADIVQSVVNGELHERPASAITSGDVLLIIDGQRRQSLYSLIVARLHDHPAVQIHLNFVERWWEEIEAAYDRWWRRAGKTDLLLLEAVQSRGSRVTTVQTIQNWVRCAHCPEDVEDMRRVAEVLRMPFSEAHYRSIYLAAQRIHVLHRNISRRLNTWLQRRLEGFDATDEILDGVVDDELHLTLRDFHDSVSLLEVLSVETVDHPVSRSSLGILRRGE